MTIFRKHAVTFPSAPRSSSAGAAERNTPSFRRKSVLVLRTLILFMLRGAWHTNKRVVATDMYDDGQRTCSPPSRQRLSFDHHIQRRLASSQGRRGRVARFTKGSPLVGMSSAHPCRTRSGGMSAFLSEGRAFLKGRAFYKGRTFYKGRNSLASPEGSACFGERTS